MPDGITFDCGDFLPGLGPNNFPDYDPNGDDVLVPDDDVDVPTWTARPVDDGGGPPIQPGPDPVPKPSDPPPPPGPGVPGPQTGIPSGPAPPPPGPGPISPGPQGPAVPGSTDKCICRVQNPPTVEVNSSTGGDANGLGKYYKVCWEQKCESFPANEDVPPDTSVDDYATAVGSQGARNITVEGTQGGNCKKNGACGGDCPEICLRYFVPRDIEDIPPGPIDTEPPGPGPDQPGGPQTGIPGGPLPPPHVPPPGVVPGPQTGIPPGPAGGGGGGPGGQPGPQVEIDPGVLIIPDPGPTISRPGNQGGIGGGLVPDPPPGGGGINPGGNQGGIGGGLVPDPPPGGGISPGGNQGGIGGGLVPDPPPGGGGTSPGGNQGGISGGLVPDPKPGGGGINPGGLQTGFGGIIVTDDGPLISGGIGEGIPGTPGGGGSGDNGITPGGNQGGAGGILVTDDGPLTSGGLGETGTIGTPGGNTGGGITFGGNQGGIVGGSTEGGSTGGNNPPIRDTEGGGYQEGLGAFGAGYDSSQNELNLNDPRVQEYFARKRPSGIYDQDIAIQGGSFSNKFVRNDVGHSGILGDYIHESIQYILKNNKFWKDWDSRPVFDITTDNILHSLDPQFYATCKDIRRVGGDRLTDYDIARMVGSRIVDGTLGSIRNEYLVKLSDKGRKRQPLVIRSSSNTTVNEMAALSLIERSYLPLDPSKAKGFASNVLPNWKILSTDIAKHIPIEVSGVIVKYYVGDTDFFLARKTLRIEDGDFITCVVNGSPVQLYTNSEKDHAFLMDSATRQRALKLLGSDGKSTLSVSSMSSDELEFNYSLSSPRQDYYVLSCVLSSLQTVPSLGANNVSNLVKTTTARYELMDSTTSAGLSSINDYIKYKANSKTLILDDDDRILDYIESTSAMEYTQDDILFDAAKTNKKVPLLTRQIPWYIVVYPTNRFEYNIHNSKSKVTVYEPSGITQRELRMSPSIDNVFSKGKSRNFVRLENGYPNSTNVYGKWDTQAKISRIEDNMTAFKQGYRVAGVVGSASVLKPKRKRTGFRLLKEIISEINRNYLLDDEGLEVGLNTYDVFSRMNMREYNSFLSLENASYLLRQIKNGAIEGIKLYNPIRNAGKNAIKKTRIVQKKSTAGEDTFLPIKSIQGGTIVQPPGTTFNSSQIVPSTTRPPIR